MGASEFTRMFLLTFSFIGLQFCWGTEMTYATPYLLALGLSKSRLSLVWLAGPLGGLIIQPVVGMISDKSRSKYGRRRPFMLAGSMGSALGLLILGWAKEIAGIFFHDAEQQRKAAIVLAIVDIYVLDFVINIAQSTCRALVVDTLPVSKQQLGSAWCSRMAGIGHIMVYFIGSLDLNAVLPGFMGDTQFKKVCFIAAFAMAVSQGVTCIAVHERVLVSDGSRSTLTGKPDSLLSIVRQIYATTTSVPARIEAICLVQFWAWIGWFPFMFYGSTWVGEIYLRHAKDPAASTEDALTLVGRLGSTAMIASSTISLIAAIVVPWITRNPDETLSQADRAASKSRRSSQPAVPVLASTSGILRRLRKLKPSLLNMWTASNIMFMSSMLFAPAVTSVGFATFLLALCGWPAAVNGLASGTFIGIEVNKMGLALPTTTYDPNIIGNNKRDSLDSIEMTESLHVGGGGGSDALHLLHDPSHDAVASTGELSGIYLGILNIYTTLPQFVGTAISWIVFSIFEPGKSPELADGTSSGFQKSREGVSGIGVCLFIGALGAGVAAVMSRRLVKIQ